MKQTLANVYRKTMAHYLNLIIPSDSSLLEIGCGSGLLLKMLHGASKIGIDGEEAAIEAARSLNPEATFFVARGEAFVPSRTPEYILLCDTLNNAEDIQAVLEKAHSYAGAQTRLVISCYNTLWRPLLAVATFLGLRAKQLPTNWVSRADLENLVELADWEIIRNEARILCPIEIPLLSHFLNRWIAPLLPCLCLAVIVIARPRSLDIFRNSPSTANCCVAPYVIPAKAGSEASPMPLCSDFSAPRASSTSSAEVSFGRSLLGNIKPMSVSVIIPARNESGNIAAAVARTPQMGLWTELIFIEGNSTDDTWQAIQKIKAEYPELRIKLAQQPGRGKGDAVRLGYAMAEGEVLMILDADLTTPPEDMPKFYHAIASGACEFANGSRLVYPMEKKAMQFCNLCVNKIFGILFSWLLGQQVKDTLCGTKVLTRKNYLRLAANRNYFGDFDPFGDFDLLFGANKLNLKIRDIPVRYRERTYGSTNITRWSCGVLLLRMLLFAAKKMKFV